MKTERLILSFIAVLVGLLVAGIGDFHQGFHLLFKFITKESIMDSNHPLNIDVPYAILSHVFLVKSRLYQVNTGHVPLFI